MFIWGKNIRNYSKFVKLSNVVEGDPKVSVSIATTPRCRGGRNSFSGLPHFRNWIIQLSQKSTFQNIESKF